MAAAARAQINFKISDRAQLTALHATAFIPTPKKWKIKMKKKVCGKVWLTHVHNKWETSAIQYENIAWHASLHNSVVWGFESRQTMERRCGFFPSWFVSEYPLKLWILEQVALKIKMHLMKMTITMAMKMERRAMEMIFPTGSGRDSLDLHDLNKEMKSLIHGLMFSVANVYQFFCSNYICSSQHIWLPPPVYL